MKKKIYGGYFQEKIKKHFNRKRNGISSIADV
jgi:hypothetical protein